MNPWIQISCALLWNLFAAGPIFGFAALKPVLVAQGVYKDLCPDDEPSCTAQDLKLNVMFTVAAGLTNIFALAVGFILDNKGPRVSGYIGSALIAIGSLLFANSDKIDFVDPYLYGYIFLAIGGPFVFISTFQLTNAVPQHSGKILAGITGAFDTSSALFMVYRVYYQNVAPLSLHTFFTAYLVVPVFITLCEFFIMPGESYSTLGATQKLSLEGLDEEGNLPEGVQASSVIRGFGDEEQIMHRHMSQSLLEPMSHRQSAGGTRRSTGGTRRSARPSRVDDRRRKSVLEEVVGQRLKSETGGLYGVLHGKSVRQQVKTPWFGLVLTLTVICMLRLNYFMATVRSQETYLLGSATAGEKMGAIFDVVLPVGGVIAIPFIGVFLDNLPTLTVLKIMCTVSVAIGVLGLFHNFTLNLLGILILVVYRPFYYTVISDYCTKVFGFETFGTVYGLIMTTSGVLNMGQTIVDRLTHTVFHMDPTPMNAAMTVATAIVSYFLITFASKSIDNDSDSPFDETSPLISESAVV